MGPVAAFIPIIVSTLSTAGAGAAAAAGSASALTIASTALSAGAAIYGGVAANQAGKYQAKVANMNAAQADRNAQNALIAGNEKESRLKMQVGRTIASQRAAEAANGVDVDIGSAVDIANSSQLEGAADAATLHWQAMQEAFGYSQEAWSDRANAKMAKAEGRNKLIGSVFSASGSLLSGASSLAKQAAAAKGVGLGGSAGAHEYAHAYGGS